MESMTFDASRFPDPRIEHPRDAIIKVTACAICGSDLHIYNGIVRCPTICSPLRDRDWCARGGYAGGQAQYLRVPYADVGPIKVPDGMPDEQVLFLSDIFPTGYMAADFCDIKGGETIAVWGCGPVGQFAIRSAILLGAGRVIAIDTVPERLALARDGRAETLDFMAEDVYDRIMEFTTPRPGQPTDLRRLCELTVFAMFFCERA